MLFRILYKHRTFLTPLCTEDYNDMVIVTVHFLWHVGLERCLNSRRGHFYTFSRSESCWQSLLKLSIATFSMMYWLPSSGGLTTAWTLQFEEWIPNFRKYRPPLPCPSKPHTFPVQLMRPGIGQDASCTVGDFAIKGDVVCWCLYTHLQIKLCTTKHIVLEKEHFLLNLPWKSIRNWVSLYIKTKFLATCMSWLTLTKQKLPQ